MRRASRASTGTSRVATAAVTPERRPWSRHDLAFAASALALAVLGGLAYAEGWSAFEAFPRLGAAAATEPLLLAAALAACVLLPFADRRGVGR